MSEKSFLHSAENVKHLSFGSNSSDSKLYLNVEFTEVFLFATLGSKSFETGKSTAVRGKVFQLAFLLFMERILSFQALTNEL